MSIISLLLLVNLSITLSQLLMSAFTSLRKLPNFPPTTKPITYPTSYLHSLSSLLLRWKRHSCSNQRSATPLRLCIPSPFTSTSLLRSNENLRLNSLYWIIYIKSWTPVVTSVQNKERINFPSAHLELTIPVVLKLYCVFDSSGGLVKRHVAGPTLEHVIQ